MVKRKRFVSSISSERHDAGDVDISSVLAGKRRKTESTATENMDEDLGDLIHTSVTQRNVKSGTEVIKQTKSKVNIAKGEVGGGSFQSMGEYHIVVGLS